MQQVADGRQQRPSGHNNERRGSQVSSSVFFSSFPLVGLAEASSGDKVHMKRCQDCICQRTQGTHSSGAKAVFWLSVFVY